MPIQQKILAIVFSFALMLVIIVLVKKKKLLEELSFAWILLGIFIILFAVWDDILRIISNVMQIKIPINILYFLGIFALIVMNLFLGVRITVLAKNFKNLVQKIAIMEGMRNNKKDEE